jgi:V8-like Glu-specific endopeptidase
VLACLALLALPGTAAAAHAPEMATSLSPARLDRIRSFWTPARMRQAKPLAAASTQPSGLIRAPTASGSEVPHRYPPLVPSRGALASSTAETVPDPTAPGLAQNGAVFIALPHGLGTARCSGTSIDAPNRSLVITAGHCVHEFGRWFAHKWIFVPGYRYGERPFGTFVAHWLGSTPEWLAHDNENFDVGAAVVSRNERGQRLADAVGAAGIAWGLSPNQVFDVYGYPVAPPFNGSTLQHCPQTPFEGHDLSSFLYPGPLNLGIECNVTPGSSGGGWVIAGGYLNSVTSSGYPDDPATEFGPYFGKAVARLFARASRVK